MQSNTETEQWYINRLIDGKYVLEDEGELISSRTKRPMKKELIRSGYLWWRTRDADNKSRYILVHRLMYLWFVGDLDSAEQVNHIDNNRINNNLNNLEKTNNSGNQIHRVKTSTHNTAKLSKYEVEYIFKLHKEKSLTAESRKEVCSRYNIAQSSLSNIINGKTWSYYTEAL